MRKIMLDEMSEYIELVFQLVEIFFNEVRFK